MKRFFFVVWILLIFLATEGVAQQHLWHDNSSQYCQPEDFSTDEIFFRATMLGESRDPAIARKKALINVRGQLAGNIQTLIKTVFDVYTTSNTSADRYEYLARQIVKQKITGMMVVCSRTVKTADGIYRSYVAVELPRSSITNELERQTISGEGLQEGYCFSDFELKLKNEMKKAGKQKQQEIIIR